MKWSEIVKDKRYITASSEEKEFIREDWYKNAVQSDPRYKPELDIQIRQDIFGETKPKPIPTIQALTPEKEKVSRPPTTEERRAITKKYLSQFEPGGKYYGPEKTKVLNWFVSRAPAIPIAMTSPAIFAGYEALQQSKNALVSYLKKEEYSPFEVKLLTDLLPESTPGPVKTALQLTEWGADVALIAGAANLAKQGLLKQTLKEVGTKLEKAGYGKDKVVIPKEAIKQAVKGTTLEKEVIRLAKAKGLKIPAKEKTIPQVSIRPGETVEQALTRAGTKPLIEPLKTPPAFTPALQPLIEEAKKYKTAEEFIGQYKKSKKFGLTDYREISTELPIGEGKIYEQIVSMPEYRDMRVTEISGREVKKPITIFAENPLDLANSKIEIIDGWHRLRQAIANKSKAVPVKIISPDNQLTSIWQQAQAEVKPMPTAKEPWQMTKEEFLKPIIEEAKERGADIAVNVEYTQKRTHKGIVQAALSEGKPVPPEVLKDYPELAKLAPEAPITGIKTGVIGWTQPLEEKVATLSDNQIIEAQAYLETLITENSQLHFKLGKLVEIKKPTPEQRGQIKRINTSLENNYKLLNEQLDKYGINKNQLPEFAKLIKEKAEKKIPPAGVLEAVSQTNFIYKIKPGEEWKMPVSAGPKAKTGIVFKKMTSAKAISEIEKTLQQQSIQYQKMAEGEYIKISPYEQKLEKMYQEGAKKQAKQAPSIGLSIKETSGATPEGSNAVKEQTLKIINAIDEKTKDFFFYKEAPKELRNSIRTDVIGGVTRIKDKIYNKTATALFGGLNNDEIAQAVELIYARNQLSRVKLGKGDPRLTVENAEEILAETQENITNPEIIASANRWNEINNDYFNDLVERGKLSLEDKIEDYAPIYVTDYTPDWAFNKGIPSRLKRPFRGYIRRALGTQKEYRKDVDALLGHLISIEHDNLIEDFIRVQADKYDITRRMTDEEKIGLFGSHEQFTPKIGYYKVPNSPRPGRIYNYKGVKYRAYNPDIPFNRQIFPLEVEDKIYSALGKFKKTYLLPENVYKTFTRFSEIGGNVPFLYDVNKIVGLWKSWAILSHFPSFNVNNLVGDTWMALVQAPEPAKLLSNIDDALSYLSKTPDKFSPYQQKLHQFMINNAVLDSAFISAEIPHIRKADDPIHYILKKAQNISTFREEIIRTAQASYLLKKLGKGEGEAIKRYFSWIDTEDLPLDRAMGKIARETLIDYNAMSKTYRRFIRGGAFPFATWYFKGTNLMWRFLKHKPLKAILGLLSLPLAMNLLNHRDKKTMELERNLPDYVRHRIHLILGETPDSKIKVWSGQLPQDVLIGTKIFSIASNEAFRVMTGEKTLKKAGEDTLKEWGIKEAKSIAYLSNFIVRYIQGLIQQKDPYDGSPIYPTDKRRMSAMNIAWHDGLFFIKSSAPFLSMYMREYSQGKTAPEAMQRVIKDTVGLPVLGIRDYSHNAEVVVDGKRVNWDTYKELQEKMQKEANILISIQDDFIRMGVEPLRYYQTDKFKNNLQRLRKLHGAKWNISIEQSLDKRIRDSIENNARILQEWAQNNYDRAKTQEERIYWNDIAQQMRSGRIIKSIKQLPKSVR